MEEISKNIAKLNKELASLKEVEKGQLFSVNISSYTMLKEAEVEHLTNIKLLAKELQRLASIAME